MTLGCFACFLRARWELNDVPMCSSFSTEKSQNVTTKVFGSTDRQRPTLQGSNCMIYRSKIYSMMAGPQDTLNEKGQIEIDEVESIQSFLVHHGDHVKRRNTVCWVESPSCDCEIFEHLRCKHKDGLSIAAG